MKKLLLVCLLNLFLINKTYALIEVDITRGNLNPLPLAVSPLSIDTKSKKSFEKILNQKNTTIILISHDIDILKQCNSVYEIKDKKILIKD